MKQISALNVTDLTKQFPQAVLDLETPSTLILDKVSFTLEEGEVLAIIGPNGSGKSTLLELLASILTPTSGTIAYFGKNFFTHRSELLEKIAYSTSYTELPPQLTIQTYLDLHAQLYGIKKSERSYYIEKYLKYFGLWNLMHNEPSKLSSGQKARISLIRAFISQPKIMLLDEPTAHLDPTSTEEIRTFIKEQQKEHALSICFTSHHMDEVSEIAHRVLVIKQGKAIALDSVSNLGSLIAKHRITICTEDPEKLCAFLERFSLIFHREGTTVIVETSEKESIPLLSSLALEGISYSQITIGKATLHDYLIGLGKKE